MSCGPGDGLGLGTCNSTNLVVPSCTSPCAPRVEERKNGPRFRPPLLQEIGRGDSGLGKGIAMYEDCAEAGDEMVEAVYGEG
jgi:hypothetical protein